MVVMVSVAAVAGQKLKSLTTSAKGKGTIKIANLDEHQLSSVMVILKENGDADFTFYADLQISATGTWSMGESLSDGVDIKITGGVVSGNATGSGKLFLRQDGKSIDRLTLDAKTTGDRKVTLNFVADEAPKSN
jgi:hypothetical protein